MKKTPKLAGYSNPLKSGAYPSRMLYSVPHTCGHGKTRPAHAAKASVFINAADCCFSAKNMHIHSLFLYFTPFQPFFQEEYCESLKHSRLSYACFTIRAR
jgi:hypothetical protein